MHPPPAFPTFHSGGFSTMTDTAHAAARPSCARFLEFVERLLNLLGIYLAALLLIATAVLQPASLFWSSQ
jgi:hypothetical protein